MKKSISKQTYDYLINGLNSNTYVNHICNIKSKLGSISTFDVKGADLTIKLKCTQTGGMFTGNYCYIPVN